LKGEAIDCGLIQTGHVVDEMEKCTHICNAVKVIKETAEKLYIESYFTEKQNKKVHLSKYFVCVSLSLSLCDHVCDSVIV
jgi:hypothetical protein